MALYFCARLRYITPRLKLGERGPKGVEWPRGGPELWRGKCGPRLGKNTCVGREQASELRPRKIGSVSVWVLGEGLDIAVVAS
jgi:hypothetical protein